MSTLTEIVKTEPWRTGAAKAKNALDPLWNPLDYTEFCGGEVLWEGTSKWWICKKCGYCSTSPHTDHFAVKSPVEDLLTSFYAYLKKREEEGLSKASALLQAAFLSAVVLKYAALLKGNELREYVEQLRVK